MEDIKEGDKNNDCISHSDRENPEGVYEGLHGGWSLGICKFVAANCEEHFSEGNQNILRDLPQNRYRVGGNDLIDVINGLKFNGVL